MPRIRVNNVGAIGIVQDVDRPAHTLPPEAWSDGQNIRFRDNKVIKFTGHKAVFDPPSIAPYWALGTPTTDVMHWLYAGLADVYTFQGGVHTKITRASGVYSATAKGLWNGGLLGGVPVITNGVDAPQFWSKIDPSTLLADLTNWPANTSAKIIQPFKDSLIALNVTKSGTEFAHLIKFSHPADPGSVPVSWDETDATKDAGEFDLTDVDAGVIRDGLAFKDTFIIYKDSATHGLQFIGGSFIFRRYTIFETSGILTQDCVAAVPRGKGHFVATGDDLIIHDGQQVRSLLDRRWKRFLSNSIDPDNFDRSFCVANFAAKEMWFCFPELGKTLPTLALVWSLVDETLGIRDLVDISYIAHGPIVVTDTDDWDSDSNTWDSDTTIWNDPVFTPQSRRLLACDPTNTKLYQMDSSEQFNGTNMTSFIERQGLAMVGVDRQGQPIVDFEKRKLVTRMWPRITGGPVNISIGKQEQIGGAVTYSPSISFDPSTDEFIDPDPSPNGRLIAVKFESAGDIAWELQGYDLELTILGDH